MKILNSITMNHKLSNLLCNTWNKNNKIKYKKMINNTQKMIIRIKKKWSKIWTNGNNNKRILLIYH